MVKEISKAIAAVLNLTKNRATVKDQSRRITITVHNIVLQTSIWRLDAFCIEG